MEEDDQVLSPASLNNWNQFHRSLHHSMTKVPFLSEPNGLQLPESSMVVIRERNPLSDHDDCSIFPPINHENLHNSSLCEQDESISHDSPSLSSSSSSVSLSSPSSSFSPSDSESPLSSKPSDTEAPLAPKPSGFRVRNSREVSGWLMICFEIVRSKLFSLVSSFQNYASERASILPAAVAMAMFWWLNRLIWRRRRRNVESLARLSNVIKEKDEKIAQLLRQIAQMNEVLLNHHINLTAKFADSLENRKRFAAVVSYIRDFIEKIKQE